MIETGHLTKVYGDLKAVDDFTLVVEEGQLFGLLGPNGSGKTTMIRLLTGQIRPTSGSARVMGLDVLEHPIRIRKLTGIIPEQETPPSFLTAEEYLEFVGKIRRLDNTVKEAEWWFDFLEFNDKKDVLCKDLSRGTRQKLMLAQAFLHHPKLALIDEPLINFDPVMQRKVKDYLMDYVKNGGTVFISTHILSVAEEICTDFAIINRGRLIHTGKIRDLKEEQRHLDEFFLKFMQGDGDV